MGQTHTDISKLMGFFFLVFADFESKEDPRMIEEKEFNVT